MPTTAGIVDHVLIGQSGVYAINVIAKRHFKQGSAQLEGNEVSFSTSKHPHSVVDIAAKSTRLQKELSKKTGHDIRVRSVIAIPGWDINEQTSADHLLVNERSLPMLTGWKDKADYLMNEDVDALHDLLTSRCKLTVDSR